MNKPRYSTEKLEWMRGYYSRNRAKIREYQRKYHAIHDKTPKRRKRRHELRDIRRDFIFSVLGDVCAKCGFSDKRALQMDHTNGRKGEKRIGNIDARWRFVRDHTEKAKSLYQILCANCNFIKREEMDEHFYHGLDPMS